MASNIVSFENLDFADLTRNGERCRDANARDPMSYVMEGRYGISVITDTSDWLCASGIHLAAVGKQIQESRTVSPRFGLLTPEQEESVIKYHSDELARYQQAVDPELEAWRAAKIKDTAQKVLLCGSRLLGGVTFRQKDDEVKGDIFFALHLKNQLPLKDIKQEIARRSFTAEALVEIFDRTKTAQVDEEPSEKSHLTLVTESVAA
jgi:hypothetical protein